MNYTHDKIKETIVNRIIAAFTSYAGDIPESLLQSEEAQIFFGEVVAYHPYAMGNFKITVGKVYLFTYYDDANSTDIFEVTTYDTRTLKLKHVEGDMWKRFEKYMHEGKYGEARIEGVLPY